MFAVTQTASKALAAPSEASKTRPGRVVVAKAVPHSVIESGKKAVLTGFLAATVALGSVDPADASTVFAGKYIDPNHPHCPREIDANGVISGVDPVPFAKGRGCRGYKKKNESAAVDAGKITLWSIKGVVAKDDASILIDFDQKDGSGESFTGKWNGVGIEFPDGNVWEKIDAAGKPTSGAILSEK